MGEMVDITLDQGSYPCPAKTGKIALIDADTILFASCSVLAYSEELLTRDLYTASEWEDIVSDPGYVEELHRLEGIDIEDAYEHSLDKINSILDRTGCIDFELHFTVGRKSFPYEVSTEYKANRISNNAEDRPPYGIYLLKQLFKSKHPEKAFLNTKWEADHIVVCKKRDFYDKYTLCAVDKDVLYTLPGEHWNYYNSTKYDIPMKWVTVTEEEAVVRYYIQTLTGDSGDGVIGLYGIGPKKAEKALRGCSTEREMWEAVVSVYENHNRDMVDALINFRLVDMRQLELIDSEALEPENMYKVKLWKPVK